MIAYTFRLLLCCLVTDGGGGIDPQVAAARARDLPQKPVYLIFAAHSRCTTEIIANCSCVRP
jgi:hypothetical protein